MLFCEFFFWLIILFFDVNIIGGVGGFLLFLISSFLLLGILGLVFMEVLFDLDGKLIVDFKIEFVSVLVLVDVLGFYCVKENYIEEMF